MNAVLREHSNKFLFSLNSYISLNQHGQTQFESPFWLRILQCQDLLKIQNCSPHILETKYDYKN